MVWKVELGGGCGWYYKYCTFLPWFYLSAVWPIRDLDDEVSYSLDGGSVELEFWDFFCKMRILCRRIQMWRSSL